jgi:hypothetical protein
MRQKRWYFSILMGVLLGVIGWGMPVMAAKWDIADTLRVNIIVAKDSSFVTLGSASSAIRGVKIETDTLFFDRANKDVYLIRKAANQLQTPDTVFVGGVTANGMLYVTTSGQVRSTGAPTNGQVLIGSTGAAPVLAALTGTANQITVTNGAGSITLATPQNIDTTAAPTFGGLKVAAGTAATPSLRGSQDPNTGLNFLGADTLEFSSGGTRRGYFLTGTLVMAADISMTDDDWIGLGGSAGRIAFDDQAVDELEITGNVGINLTSFGTSANSVLGMGNGTAPSSSPADAFQIWSADRGSTAGKAGLHLRTEDGTQHVLADRVGFGTLTPGTGSGVSALEISRNQNAADATLILNNPGTTGVNRTVHIGLYLNTVQSGIFGYQPGATSAIGDGTEQFFIGPLTAGGILTFFTGGSGSANERWRITSAGVFQSNGAQTVQTSTGVLTLATGGGGGNISVDPNGTGIILLESEIRVNGDTGGAAGYTSFTDAENTATARSTGVGTIKFADATNRDNAGFIKIYLGTTAYYLPVFTAN